jgi:nucleoside-diphosphate-sugar epimerase
MTAIVTGAAGFIGSHLVERLLADGVAVRGIDCFTPYYERQRKEAHLREALQHPAFELVEADLRDADLPALLQGADVVYHLAAQPGVRPSWSEGFATYVENNVLVTQRILEEARSLPGLRRLVLASSSSVYGAQDTYPTTEDSPCRPSSPYGVTKLATEALSGAYAQNFGVPTVCLRYFTVYGPRQRPDMAMARLIAAACDGTPFPRYGDGEQRREFTHVADVVEATVRAGQASADDVAPATVLNVAGGSSATLREAIEAIEAAIGRPVAIEQHDDQPGDVRVTSADITRARRLLGWSPAVPLGDGLRAQVEWHLDHVQRCAPGTV